MDIETIKKRGALKGLADAFDLKLAWVTDTARSLECGKHPGANSGVEFFRIMAQLEAGIADLKTLRTAIVVFSASVPS